MKINWGQGIALFYSVFVLAMVLMVIRSAQNNVELVQANYYDQDLDYENFRQKRQNGTLSDQQVAITFVEAEKQLQVRFPAGHKNVKGKLILYRPSNQFQDKIYPIRLDEGSEMSISTEGIASGLWRVKLDWKAEENKYYQEELIIF